MKKANEYNAWYRNNDPQNARKGFEEYNRPFAERYQRPAEYYKRPEEYQHYPERYDYTKDQDPEKADENKENQDQQQNNPTSKLKSVGKSIVKTVVGNAVAIVVGAVVLVTGYNALVINSIHTFDATWVWSDDYQNVTLKLVSEDKSIKKEFNAVVTLTDEVLATCVSDGYRIYTASGDYEEVTYTDVRNEILHAHGHHFDEGVLVDGHIEYTCSDCGEKVVVDADIEEID